MKTIFLTGAFDVIHVGHIRLLSYARSHGDRLVVATDTDERIKSHKGKDRPFNRQQDRIEVLKSIRYIDEVMTFGSNEQLIDIVSLLHPDVWFAGSDWEGKYFPGKEYAKSVEFFPRIEPYSTTRILA